MKVRLHGTPAEVTEATRCIAEVLDLVLVSEPHADRGASVPAQVYLEVDLDPTGPTTSPSQGRAGRRPGRALP